LFHVAYNSGFLGIFMKRKAEESQRLWKQKRVSKLPVNRGKGWGKKERRFQDLAG